MGVVCSDAVHSTITHRADEITLFDKLGDAGGVGVILLDEGGIRRAWTRIGEDDAPFERRVALCIERRDSLLIEEEDNLAPCAFEARPAFGEDRRFERFPACTDIVWGDDLPGLKYAADFGIQKVQGFGGDGLRCDHEFRSRVASLGFDEYVDR